MSNQLFFLSLADIFSVYPQIFRELISEHDTNKYGTPVPIYLPTDWSWKERIYARLLIIQKRINESIEGGMTFEDVTKRKDTPVFDSSNDTVTNIINRDVKVDGKKLCTILTEEKNKVKSPVTTWTLEIIAKAAKLLRRPPLSVNFDNELEMRRVYSLIYDVFRYKVVLSNVLKDVSFFTTFSQFTKDENRIWLMLYELLDRRFLGRPSELIQSQILLYTDAQVIDIANCLWDLRVRLAGSVSRLRIRYRANNLSQLLPIHLQNEKVALAAANSVVTGWINPFLLRNRSAAEKVLAEMGFELLKDFNDNNVNNKRTSLGINQYKWDNVCPLFIACVPNDRSEFSRSPLIRKHFFIMQVIDQLIDNQHIILAVEPTLVLLISICKRLYTLSIGEKAKALAEPFSSQIFACKMLQSPDFHLHTYDKTFSFGPAIMSKLLDHFELDGDILQTHISSPRSTAYLAALFHSVNRVNNYYVYGAGVNLREYRTYMETLGISNIRIFHESFTSFPLKSNRFATVVGIFANPPNSYSAIADPIDLICSRGGDLSMLEVLTESEISDDGKLRVSLILEEQYHTLLSCLSRSHTQFVLYQTHSIVQTENEDMVKHTVRTINGNALDKHKFAFRDKKRLQGLFEAEAANLSAAAIIATPRRPAGKSCPENDASPSHDEINGRHNEQTEDTLNLPEIDEFVIDSIPDICINQDNCLNQSNIGSFFSLIRRKTITRHNAKYLIQMAECRGLFGSKDGGTKNAAKFKPISKLQTLRETPTQTDFTGNKSELKVDLQQDRENLLKRLQRNTFSSTALTEVQRMSMMQYKPYNSIGQLRICQRCDANRINLSDPSIHIRFRWRAVCRCAISDTSREHPKIGRGYINARKRHFPRRGSRLPIHINLLELRT